MWDQFTSGNAQEKFEEIKAKEQEEQEKEKSPVKTKRRRKKKKKKKEVEDVLNSTDESHLASDIELDLLGDKKGSGDDEEAQFNKLIEQ